MKIGISIIVRGDAAGRETFEQTAAHAEALAWDCCWASDHLVMPALRVSKYPGRADGQLPDAWKRTYYQPFSVLNYLAGQTQRVRLGMSVLILPIRNPIEVAAQVAELDCLSAGRVNFGIGVGWFREEFEALGYNFSNRGRRTDDGIDLIKTLWRQAKTTVNGPDYTFEAAEIGPKPVQQPHPPIYIGGHSSAALKRVARYGDVWHPLKLSPTQIAEVKPRLAHALAEANRPSDNFPIAPKIPLAFQDGPATAEQALTIGRPSDIVDALKRYQEAGAEEFCFDIITETLPVALDTMSRFNDEVRPHL